MPEFRQNFASKEWVIIATERAQRPHEFSSNKDRRPTPPPHVADCPFCKGNEDKTPPPKLVIRNEESWKVRVVPNKFAAVNESLDRTMHKKDLFVKIDGYGIAEVVIETPDHSKTIGTMSDEEVLDVLLAYRSRYRSIAADPKVALVNIFRNHGPKAGTSLEHPHSQIIATPIVPAHVRDPVVKLMRAYDTYGTCIYCDMLKEELKAKERIIMETGHFVVISPYAARSPFEVRIYPKRHSAVFGDTDDEELRDLAETLRVVMRKIYVGLDNPDYNYIIHSAPLDLSDSRFFHWAVIIVPRLTTPAGFEMGTGIYINTTLPEHCADFLRETEV